MIRSFKDRDTEQLAKRVRVPRFGSIERIAQRKLAMIEAAVTLEDLKIPPANRLEKLSRDRKGQYSIRINDQWRICFEWRDEDAREVEIVDYH